MEALASLATTLLVFSIGTTYRMNFRQITFMRISNRVKRNTAFILMLVGIACIIARTWNLMTAPSSGKLWFDLFGSIIITFLCFDNYMLYRRRVKKGILFGSE